MKRKKYLLSAVCGILIVGGLAGCGLAAAQSGSSSAGEEPSGQGFREAQESPLPREAQEPQEATSLLAVAEVDSSSYNEAAYEEIFKPYEPFGLVYDASQNQLQYNGRPVRWFEDYYTIPDGGQAGNDFFNENGVVDIYAVRDFSSFIRSDDGSFDPSGKLVGIKEFSEEEFASRDIEALKNPPRQITASSGEPISEKEREKMLKEYAPFGLTYDEKDDQWYLDGEKVRFCRDVLISNGESLTGGKFKGAIRTFESTDGGTIDIYTVRDFTDPNADGYGTLTGIEKYSQQEFDEHTQSSKEVQSSSGLCTVTQD